MFFAIIFSDCIQKHLKAGNTECPQCGVKIQGKSLTRNSSYSTMVQCITKIRNLLNGVPNTPVPKEDPKEQEDVLISILDGIIEGDEKENKIEEPGRSAEKRKSVYEEKKPNAKKVKEPKLDAKAKVESKLDTSTTDVKTKNPLIKQSSKPKRYGLLLTGLSDDQKATIQSNLQNLSKLSGGLPFKIIKDYSADQVTHIICACAPKSHCPRTLKYLLGIAGKSWVVSFEWILESIERGTILREEPFVVVGDEAVRCDTNACEKSRNDPGKLFDGHEFYLNGSFTGPGPSKTDLNNLIQLAGGIVTKKPLPKCFIISDSNELKKDEYPYTWLFDSVSFYKMQI